MNSVPIVLEGNLARLEPVGVRHAEELYNAGRSPAIWQYLLRPPLSNLNDSRSCIEEMLSAARDGSQLSFVMIEKRT